MCTAPAGAVDGFAGAARRCSCHSGASPSPSRVCISTADPRDAGIATSQDRPAVRFTSVMVLCAQHQKAEVGSSSITSRTSGEPHAALILQALITFFHLLAALPWALQCWIWPCCSRCQFGHLHGHDCRGCTLGLGFAGEPSSCSFPKGLRRRAERPQGAFGGERGVGGRCLPR